MELRQLEHVLAVIETGSLTAAASRVGLTQQALSKSLSRLEDTLGGKLFEREARGMAPTRLGETVAEHARDMIASAGRLKSAAAAELGLERGKLVIGLSPISATSEVGRRVVKFAESHPLLRMDIEAGIDKQFVAALHSGSIDLAISSQTETPDDGILVEPIGQEAWGVAGRKHHPQLKKASTLADLKNCQWVLGRNTGWLQAAIEESFAAAGANPPQPGIMTTSVIFALATLTQSDYLAILPRSLCASMPDLLWRDLAKGNWFCPIYIMRRKRAHISLGVQQLLQELRKR
jgi:DNA-binding transcriptional LysR family regulator